LSSNTAQFISRLNQYIANMSVTPKQSVQSAATLYKTSINAEISRATGGKNRLSGVGKNGARVGVRSKVFATSETATAIISASGPLHLLERDNKKHDIPRTESSRRLRTPAGRLSYKREATGRALSGRKVLFLKGAQHPILGPVHHPGTKGKHPFEKGVNRAERDAVAATLARGTAAMAKVFSR
jgi:hypothetical protein